MVKSIKKNIIENDLEVVSQKQYNTFGIVRNSEINTNKLKEYLLIEEKKKIGEKSKNEIVNLYSPEKFAELIHRLITNMYKNEDILPFRMPTTNINLHGVDGELIAKIDTIFGKANNKIIFEFGISGNWQGKFKADIEKKNER